MLSIRLAITILRIGATGMQYRWSSRPVGRAAVPAPDPRPLHLIVRTPHRSHPAQGVGAGRAPMTALVLGIRASRVVSVKLSNLTMMMGDAGCEPPVLVAAVAARWIDCLQFLEVKLRNGLQLLGQS